MICRKKKRDVRVRWDVRGYRTRLRDQEGIGKTPADEQWRWTDGHEEKEG